MSGEKTTIGFSGDLSFSGYFADSYTDNGLLDDGIKAFLCGNDYNVINYESPVTPCRVTKKRRLAHRSAPEALDFVKNNLPNPVLSFANNHMMDYGPIGVVDTMDSCKQRGIDYIGIGLNVTEASRYVVLGDEVKVGVLAVEYKKHLIATELNGGPLHESSTDVIKRRLKQLKACTDYVTPVPYTRRQLKEYLAWGADVVVAHHPHVVQGFEPVGKNKMIFYSLGNFVFDTNYQRVQDDTDNGMLLRLSFGKNGFTYEALPTHIDRENKRVSVGSEMCWFKDIRKGYDRAWSGEAYRRSNVKERAKQLREKELAEAAEYYEAERMRLEEIQAKADAIQAHIDIHEAMMDALEAELAEQDANEAPVEEEEKPEEASAKKKSFYSSVRAFYKKHITRRKQNHKENVIKFGSLKKKTIYR